MKSIFMNRTLSFVTKYRNYSNEEIEKLKYGLEGIYLTLTKLIIIIVLSFILNIFKEIVFLLILFNIIRYFGFGVHARKSNECLITSIILFIILPFLFLNFNILKEISFVLSVLSIISFIFFAPADTIKRPFKNKRKRTIRKILTIIVGIAYLLIGCFINNKDLSTLFFLAIITQAIVVNPITYKLMKQPYRNYKNL